MQHELKERKPLLDENGKLTEPGFARDLLWDYDRSAIKAKALRIKEWDYYYVGNKSFGVALTVADNGYMGLDSISLLDFEEGWEVTKSPMQIMTKGKKNLPPTSATGDVLSKGKGYIISFEHKGDRRILSFSMDKFKDGKPIKGEIELFCPETESMVIATPFPGNDKAFYYNQKINCMPARGTVTCGDKLYRFTPGKSCGVLDWGRGVWTYENTWYWGSSSGFVGDNVPFGFNIGYGFGDTSAASENMLFYNNKAHKLEQVTFEIPQKDGKDDFLSPWKFTSSDGRFEMDFQPVLNRHSDTNVGIIRSNQNQIFGLFTGKAILDDGTVIELKDFHGFAEKVHNKW
ncbi:MAG: DUF2804 domain-containing protein [Firmicutes bacterium]|nr:DUF2804 domain-containing protein [Bacillota bacterium]MBQ6811155.1 DUF2804 domain-containing protein [Bacillota bacterium]